MIDILVMIFEITIHFSLNINLTFYVKSFSNNCLNYFITIISTYDYKDIILFKNKNVLRTLEPQNKAKNKNAEAHFKKQCSYKMKSVY